MPYMNVDELTSRYRSMRLDVTSWGELLKLMLADPFERATVEALAEELRRKVSFRRPVVLGVFEDWREGEDGEDVLVSTVPAVEDGTHRVCAHLLSGVKNVYVQYLSEGEIVSSSVLSPVDDESHPLYWCSFETRLTVPLPFLNRVDERLSLFVDREADCRFDLWEALMSLRVDDEHWLSSPTSSSRREGDIGFYMISWDSDAFLLTPERITSAVLRKLESFGYVLDDVSVETVVEDFRDDIPVVLSYEDVLARLS